MILKLFTTEHRVSSEGYLFPKNKNQPEILSRLLYCIASAI